MCICVQVLRYRHLADDARGGGSAAGGDGVRGGSDSGGDGGVGVGDGSGGGGGGGERQRGSDEKAAGDWAELASSLDLDAISEGELELPPLVPGLLAIAHPEALLPLEVYMCAYAYIYVYIYVCGSPHPCDYM